MDLGLRLFRSALLLVRAERSLGDARTTLRIPKLSALASLAEGSPRELEEVAQAEGVTEPTMYDTLTKLAKREYVVAFRRRQDRRRRNVHLTDRGRVQLRAEKERLAAFLRDVSPEEAKTVAAALEIIDACLRRLDAQIGQQNERARGRLRLEEEDG
jgi:DNA-binding MarR family transcriptional regulator